MPIRVCIEYDKDNKILFLIEESSSGCTYSNVEIEDISDYVKNYILDCMQKYEDI